jgi:hypothetical protein
MSTDPRVPPFVEGLVRAVAGGSGEDGDERASTFARGLALGALVGAAIAGSTIWQRRHARMTAGDAPPADVVAAPDGHRPTG